MRIMMVITGMRTGGAERVMATLCNELVKKHSIRLLSLKEAKSDYRINDNVEFVGGNVLNQNIFKSIAFVKKQIDEWSPDIVLSFMTKSNIVALMTVGLSKKKVPVIIAERANPYNAGKIFKLIRRVLYPSASGAVFQTQDAQSYYEHILKCESVILKNPLNPDFKIEPYDGERKKKIITVGRLSVEKNQKLLIDAFNIIEKKYPEYSVEIYGEGPLHKELDMYIKGLGLDNKIFLMGRKDNVHQYIRDAEIFVLPSNSEGMPNALIESMALGIACIATDCPIGGSRIIIQNKKNGLLVPMMDKEQLVIALEGLICNKEYRLSMGKNAINVVKDFDTIKVCSDWEAYIEKLCTRRKDNEDF